VSIDLNNLKSVRVITTVRRNRVIDPQTGEDRQANFYYKRPDDWAGKPPAQGFNISDSVGHHLALRFLRTSADHWGAYLLGAVKAQPLLKLGPGVMETLERITPK
jgi:hypothetical protein